MLRRHPRSTRPDTLVPYPALFRSHGRQDRRGPAIERAGVAERPRRDRGRGHDQRIDENLAPRRRLARDHRHHRNARRGIIRADEQRERRSEEHTSELQSLMRISYAVFCLKKKTKRKKLKAIILQLTL